jgi:hypothetical protein
MIDTAEVLVDIRKIKGSREEHFGTPCNTPDLLDIGVYGVIRVNFEDAPLPSKPLSVQALEFAAERIAEELDWAQPVVVTEPELGIKIRLLGFSFSVIESEYAVGHIVAWEIVK